MLNRSQIMTRAWEILRRRLALYGRRFNRADMSTALRMAWGEARHAAQSATEIRATAIRRELDTLATRSFQQRVEPLRHRLETELASIAA